MRFRPPEVADGPALWRLALQNGLDENSPYAYLMWAEYFGDTSIVAERGGEVVGFVTGFRVPSAPEALFVWQIAVDHGTRGQGVAGTMLDHLAARHPWCRALEATVTPSNEASSRLFRAFGARRGAPVEEELVFAADLFPGTAHEAEVRFRIGPFEGGSRQD